MPSNTSVSHYMITTDCIFLKILPDMDLGKENPTINFRCYSESADLRQGPAILHFTKWLHESTIKFFFFLFHIIGTDSQVWCKCRSLCGRICSPSESSLQLYTLIFINDLHRYKVFLDC